MSNEKDASINLDDLRPKKGVQKAIRSRRASAGGTARRASNASSKAMRTAAIAKTPQAVVKIIGYTHSKKSIKRQINYISRDGKEPTENEMGSRETGPRIAEQTLKDWDDKLTVGIEKNGKPARLSMHVQVSMPAGTDLGVFTDVARAWGDTVFSGRQYVFAVHDDKKHPHAHFLVALKDDNGKKLNPRKDDIQGWRESFAELATMQGYPMAATRWYEHKKDRPPVEASHTASYRMLERGEVSERLLGGLLSAIAGNASAVLPKQIQDSQEAHRAAAERLTAEGKRDLAGLHVREAQTARHGRSERILAEVSSVAEGRSAVSPKMLALAEAIAKEKGLAVPSAQGDFGEVRAFLNEHARRQIADQSHKRDAGQEREA